jgi:hypothetical protein
VENVTLLDLDRVCTAAIVLDGRPVQSRVFGVSLFAVLGLGFTENRACRATLPEDNSSSAVVEMGLRIDKVAGNFGFPAGRGAGQCIWFWDWIRSVLVSSHEQICFTYST